MLWLINLIIEAIFARGMFVDRGDPGAWDFLAGDFTKDDTWRDLDLSGIVDAGAHAVLVQFAMNAAAINKRMQLRRKGNVNPISHSEIRTQVANVGISIDGIIPLGTDRIIQYRLPPYAYISIALVVKGWWF